MEDQLTIYLNLLRDGQTQKVNLELNPSFLEVDEPELRFEAPIKVVGTAYIAGDELILHITASTQGIVPCSICSEPVTVPVAFKGFYHTVQLSEIKSNAYHFGDVVRENLLLELPSFVECSGKCPERDKLKKYFKQDNGDADQEEGQQPFRHLSL